MPKKIKPPKSSKCTLKNEYLPKIRRMYLSGMKVPAICAALGFKVDKWRDWQYNNTRGFGDWYADLRRERILAQCEANLEDFTGAEETSKKIKADLTKFGLSTLGKKNYSTKSEVDHGVTEDIFSLFSKNQIDKINESKED